MKKNKTILLSLLLLLPCFAYAQITDKSLGNKQAASYWQLNQGASQTAYTYSITLESKIPDQVENEIMKIAADSGLSPSSNQPNYGYGRGSASRMLGFSTTPDKAETFCQKVITITKLKQYSNYNTLNETNFNEVRQKADRIKTEFDKNDKIFKNLPIANALMTDLLARYNNYIAAYKSSMNKASISIIITSAPQD